MAIPVIENYTKNFPGPISTTIELTKPTGVEVGDLLLLLVYNDDNVDNTFTDNLSGWNFTQDAGDSTRDCHTAIFWRIADGEEDATETVTASSSEHIGGWYVRISGVDTDDPIDQMGDSEASNTGSITIPAVSTTSDDCLVLFTAAYDGGDSIVFIIENDWTEADDEQRTGTASDDVTGLWGTKDITACGTTGTIAVYNDGASEGLAGFLIAIRGVTTPLVTHIGTPKTNTNTGTSLTIDIPVGVQNGDVLIAATSVHDDLLGAEVTSTDSKFTLIKEDGTTSGDDRQLTMWYRVISNIGSEGSNYTWTTSTSEIWSGVIFTLRGVDTSDVLDWNPISDTTDGAPNPNCESMTTLNNYSYFFACAALTLDEVTSFTPPIPMDTIVTLGAVDANIMIAGMNKKYAGATRDRQWTTDGHGGGDNVTIQFAVNGLEITSTSYNTIAGSETSWSWNTGTYGETNAMRATSDSPTSWAWGTIEDSSDWFYKIGSATSWEWISGSTDLFD